MKGFHRLPETRRRSLAIHAGLAAQLRAALVVRQRGVARQMIARQVLAALRPGGPNAERFRARFLREQADGMDLAHGATIRGAFLLRQLRRLEAKLDAE